MKAAPISTLEHIHPMTSEIMFASPHRRELGKRKREDAVQSTAALLEVPPLGSLKVLQCTLEEGNVDDGRIYFDGEFTKKLVSETLGLPSRIKTALR